MFKTRSRRCFRPRLVTLEDRAVPSASIIFVDASIAAHSTATTHDGSSWATAFDNLQSALEKARASGGDDQIWIATGTYTPSKVYAPLDGSATPVTGGASGLDVANLKTFDMPDGVALYGGFAYGMNSLDQRDPVRYPTTLSGDLAGNDVNDPTAPGYAASKADNAWHVVTAGDDVTKQGARATLDGLTIVGGYANGPNNGGTLSPFIWGHADGGGVYSTFGSAVTLNNDRFLGNFAASDGGGVFSDGSDLVATNSVFVGNAALVRAGGLEGLNDFEVGSHTSRLVNDYFQDNTCAVFGGAVVGEGAYQGPGSAMTIDGSTFVHNQAAEGGAVVFDTLTITITRSNFVGNIATVDGGALATTNVVGTIVGAPNAFGTTVSHSSFVGNVCLADPAAHATLNNFVGAPGLNFAFGGGAMVAYMNGYINADHDDFRGNVTQNGDGGAILNGNASANLFGISAFAVQTSVASCTFEGNRAPNGNGGGIASESDGLSPTSTPAATVIRVNQSEFDGNGAVRGGGIYVADTTATILNNTFDANTATTGTGIFGVNSQVNGLASSDPLAVTTLLKKNRFRSNDVVLS